MKIVPAGPTVAELEEKASQYEQRAESEPELTARLLLEKAKLCREWVTRLTSGQWSS